MLGDVFDNLHESIKRHGIMNSEGKPITSENWKELEEAYSKGFQETYFGFEDAIKKGESSLFNESSDERAKKVFDIVTKFPMISGIGFTSKVGDRAERLMEKSMFKSGIEFGEIYKAWEIILNNQILFEPLFKNRIIERSDSFQDEIQIPFKNETVLRIFNELRNKSKKKDKIRYSYIYQFLTNEKIDSALGQSEFFLYVRHLDKRVTSEKIMSGATNHNRTQELESIYQDYLKKIHPK
jgi:rRNA-processing protein FCF1